MLPRAVAVLRVAVLALFAASLLMATGRAARSSWTRIVQAVSQFGVGSQQARRRTLGASWVAAEGEIARAIPADGDYLLVDGGGERQGAALFLRYQLAPRRARFAGRLSEVTDPSQWAAGLPTSSRWVVVAYPRRPPVLVNRTDFARWLETTLGRR